MEGCFLKQQNVLLITCDQLRLDWLGCGGNPIVMTPQIDQLAREGVNFRRAMSECPVCVPARRILMTGRDPYGIHMTNYREDQPFPEGPKLAEVMTRAGYQTFASGKLHTCPQRYRIGFEDVWLNEEGRRKPDMACDDYEAFLNDNGYGHLAYTHGMGNNEYGVRISPLPEPMTTTHWTMQRAVEFLERRDPTRPFFLYVSFDKPHPPITPPAEYYELYRDAQFPPPAHGSWEQEKMPCQLRAKALNQNYDQWKDHPLLVQQTFRGMAAMITHIDSMIGVLLGDLRERGLLDQTLILFTSDHGDDLFDHDSMAKKDFLRGSSNIPFLVRPPRGSDLIPDALIGTANDSLPVGLMDVMPTILDACGLGADIPMDGQSVFASLQGKEAFRPYSFGICDHYLAVTDGRFKYHWFADDAVELLFDAQEDPQENCDLSDLAQYRGKKQELRDQLAAWLERNNEPLLEAFADGRPLLSDPESALTRAARGNVWNNRGRH